MKTSNLLLGIILGFGTCGLLSTTTKEEPLDDALVPRYHILNASNTSTCLVYDAVTGDCKKTSLGDAYKVGNLKKLLED